MTNRTKASVFWPWCLIGVILGFFSTAIWFVIAVGFYSFPVENKDHENNAILIVCEDASTEWVPMPKCKESNPAENTDDNTTEDLFLHHDTRLIDPL